MSKATCFTVFFKNCYAVVFLLYYAHHLYYVVNPCLRGEVPVKLKEKNIRAIVFLVWRGPLGAFSQEMSEHGVSQYGVVHSSEL